MKQVTVLQMPVENEKKFMSIDFLKENGLTINPEEYKVVFFGDMDIEDAEDVYMRLQGRKPEGFTGHSLSVSDIVCISGRSFYCDDYGFVDITWSEYGEAA